MNEKLEQIKTVFSDEAFVKTCLDAENEEAVQKLLADKGVEMSLTEIELLKEMVIALTNGTATEKQLEKLVNGGELSEEELGEAAGGGIVDFFCKTVKKQFFDGRELDYGEAIFIPAGQENLFVEQSSHHVLRSGTKVGIAVGSVLAAGAAAYGICKACGVDVDGGISKAYGWVSDNIARW